MTNNYFLFGLLSGVLLIAACQPKKVEHSDKGRLLASVYDKNLYLSDLEGMLPEGTTAEDSAVIITAFSERWIKDELLKREAERNVPKDLNIDELVRDYRASLVQNNYESALISERLDSTVSPQELKEFYEKNKGQYQLDKPIIQCRFIKIKLPISDPGKLRSLWNSTDPEKHEELIALCNEYAETYILEDSLWYKLEDIAAQMPKGTLTPENIKYRKEFTQKGEGYQYFFRLLGLKNTKEIAPLTYIEGQARKVILHNRKIKLIEDAKEGLYEKEKRLGNISIYFNNK